MTYYPSVENKDYISGNADAYYSHRDYLVAEETAMRTGDTKDFDRANSFFKRLQYLIKKNTEGNLTEIILLNNEKVLDIDKELQKGLDQITVSHLWRGDPYRFSHKTIQAPWTHHLVSTRSILLGSKGATMIQKYGLWVYWGP